jgi:hypothetical protein
MNLVVNFQISSSVNLSYFKPFKTIIKKEKQSLWTKQLYTFWMGGQGFKSSIIQKKHHEWF